MKSSVLIVENERATAWALSEGLAEDGYRIKAVQSSEEALRFLRRGKCDLIITDIHLPGMDGIDLLKKISSRKRIPAIIITASGSPEAFTKARKAGAVYLFSKPFRVDDVKKSVAHALTGSIRRRSVKSAGGAKA
jgi:DNA-binding NtrC family response regulator